MATGKKKTAWVAAVVVALGAAGVAWSRTRDRGPELQFETARVDRGRIVAKVTATGTLSALVTVQVGSQVSGRIQADLRRLQLAGEEGAGHRADRSAALRGGASSRRAPTCWRPQGNLTQGARRRPRTPSGSSSAPRRSPSASSSPRPTCDTAQANADVGAGAGRVAARGAWSRRGPRCTRRR